jgi:hypothetical protein
MFWGKSRKIGKTASVIDRRYQCADFVKSATTASQSRTTAGTSLSTALNTFVTAHPAFAGLTGSTGQVTFFGTVSTLPSNGTIGATGTTGLTGAAGATGATGPAGPGITWVDVTTTTQQAVSNTGYMADDGATPVTISLPPVQSVARHKTKCYQAVLLSL